MRVGLPFTATCEQCQSNLGTTDAYPSKSGMIRCIECIGSLGYETVEEANRDIFGDVDDATVERTIALLKAAFPGTAEVKDAT
jgi:hypothetical protein